MKKMLLLTGVASVFALNAQAFEFNPYLAVKAKYAFTDYSVTTDAAKYSMDKDLFGGSGILGVKFPFACGAFRAEAEYTRTNDAKKNIGDIRAELRTQALMFNAYYDFNTKTSFTPYVGFGLGGARMKLSGGDRAIHQTELAWQLGLGVAYEINEHFTADLGYRYIDYGDFSDYLIVGENKTKVEAKANEIMLGIRYTF
ncbi:MAG: porin family protein [Alphaproteobacteria bacterium]|nr:porin family protein [Alphaproteobacteria bacterium]